MKPEKVFELAEKIGYKPKGLPSDWADEDFIFSPDDLMSFAVALLEAAHIEKAARGCCKED